MNIYFGLGSNLGNRLQNLRDAAEKLRELGNVTGMSDVFETEAWGGVEQPDYLNACVKVESEKGFEPSEVLSIVKGYERELGRIESVRWGARKIDIDILLIDDVVVHEAELDVPHVRIAERLFVLVPLEEILTEGWRHPENGLGVREMIRGIEGESWPLRVTGL